MEGPALGGLRHTYFCKDRHGFLHVLFFDKTPWLGQVQIRAPDVCPRSGLVRLPRALLARELQACRQYIIHMFHVLFLNETALRG
jgi:hypothetical protein